jgi:hypothetical protein
MRVTQWIGIGLPMAAFGFGAIIFVSGARRDDRRAPGVASEGASAPGAAIGASESPALPAASAASAGPEEIESSAESSLDRELAAPEKREAASYPWQDFESILDRDLTAGERDALRDLRKEHGLRLAERRARMERGDVARAEFDAWRAARAAEFRADIAQLLGCSADQVTALLRVPMRTAAVP